MVAVPIAIIAGIVGDGIKRVDAHRKGFPQPPVDDMLDPQGSARRNQDWNERVEASMREFTLVDGPFDGKRVRVVPKAKKLKVGSSYYHVDGDFMVYEGEV
jgi:hypothetical protein